MTTRDARWWNDPASHVALMVGLNAEFDGRAMSTLEPVAA